MQQTLSAQEQQQPAIASARRVALLRGHTDAVTCLAATPDAQLLASGAEDGGLCVHHLPSTQLLCRQQLQADSEAEGVGAVAFAPLAASSSSSSEGQPRQRLLFAGVGTELLALLLEQQEEEQQQHQGVDTRQEAQHQQGAPAGQQPPAAQQQQQPAWRVHVLLRQVVGDDELSALAVSSRGAGSCYLAAADDAGDVSIFDIGLVQQQAGQQQDGLVSLKALAPLRRIAGAHDPMASAVAFRGAHKPWQLLSGGVDNRVALWDFSRSKRCCGSWSMAALRGQHPASSQAPGTGQQPDSQQQQQQQQQQDGQVWNPPMVHALATPCEPASGHPSSKGPGESEQQQQQQQPLNVPGIPAAVAKRLVAVARGDGCVAVFDADPDAPQRAPAPAAPSSTGSRGAPPKAKGSSRGAASKSKGDAKQGGSGAAAAVAATAAPTPQSLEQQPCQKQLQEVPPGFHICLDAASGGHALPAASVAFMPWASGSRFLWSGGQDGRLLLWDWPAAFAGGAAHGGADGAGALVLDVAHKRKVNALTCVQAPVDAAVGDASGNERPPVWLLVAGTSPNVNLYRVTATA